jgi:arylsulfatase A-like enzyme
MVFMPTRRTFLGALGGGALSLYAQPRRPNILFILADDLGYGVPGCYGQREIRTPNIDALAEGGMRFTQAYAGSTVCAPSRCALMTGLHTGHAFIRGNAPIDLRPEDATVAEKLKAAGYRTALIGKWGLGTAGHSGVPNRKGFDEFFGYLDQVHAHTYHPTMLWENERETFLTGNFGPLRKDYSHDIFTERALRFIGRQNASDPFFLYLAYTIPHANNEMGQQTGNGMDVPSDAPYADRSWPQAEKNFAAMVTRMDRDIGRVMDALRARGLERDTLVIFTSDNGPHREGGHDPDFFHDSGPLRGIKRDLYDGGIRVPAIASWPGTIQPGRASDAVWAFWDFLPTACELARVDAPPRIDGVSFVPALRGRAMLARDYLYWEFHEDGFGQAVRTGNWKGVRPKSRANPIELYDLSADIGEHHDVAQEHADLVSRISRWFESARTESKELPVKDA